MSRITRRSVLLGTGGLAMAGVGAGGTYYGTRKSGLNQLYTDEAEPTPAEALMCGHGVLTRILLIYRAMATAYQAKGTLPAEHLHTLAGIVADYVEGFHEHLEETYVFSKLHSAGNYTSLIDTLVQQHDRGKDLTQLILDATAVSKPVAGATGERVTEAMTAYVRMFEPHEAREDTVIFPAFRQLLTAEETLQLGQRFAALETQQFGRGGFAKTVSQVATIEQANSIYSLGQFTSPA